MTVPTHPATAAALFTQFFQGFSVEEESKWRKRGSSFRAEGVALAIPTVMVVFPVGGALLGSWAGKHFGHPWLLYLGLILGLVAGVREVIRLVKQLKAIQAEPDKKK